MIIEPPPTSVILHFYLDPICPLAWRAALWLCEARKLRPIEIRWKFFCLEIVNRREGITPDYQKDGSWAALRTMAFARRESGNKAVERLYVKLSIARHMRKQNLKDLEVLRSCVREAALDPEIVDEALADESTIQDVLGDHQEAATRYFAFGVPTIALNGSNIGYYGPIIRDIPRGEEAGEMWDHILWALRQPALFELKRDRDQVEWGPIVEPQESAVMHDS